MVGYFSISLFWILLIASSTFGEKLVARRLETRLPSPTVGTAVYYDGESDFIYLVGGDGGGFLESIVRFDISTEEIERIGNLPLGQGSWATPHAFDSQGNLVYLSTSYSPFQMHKFDIATNSIKTIFDFGAKRPYSCTTMKNSAGNLLVFGGGGFGTDIYEYNVDSDDVQGVVVGQFPEHFGSAQAVKVGNNTALVFGTRGSAPYLEFNSDTLEAKYVSVNSFPEFQYGNTVTGDRNNVYVFGGDFAPEGMEFDGFIKIDTVTHSWEYFEVEYVPPVPEHYFRFHTEVVWVEKRNRIYMFGGALRKGTSISAYLDDIYYIDLNQISPTTTTTQEPISSTLSPELFSCVDRTDGTHPHPSDCSMYISCRNGTLQGVNPCPPPLLYDPSTGNCNLPSLVDCQLSCENKEDGTYPHPNECRLFIICSNRDLFVFWCDPPLLFDPQSLRCTLPDLVQCESP